MRIGSKNVIWVRWPFIKLFATALLWLQHWYDRPFDPCLCPRCKLHLPVISVLRIMIKLWPWFAVCYNLKPCLESQPTMFVNGDTFGSIIESSAGVLSLATWLPLGAKMKMLEEDPWNPWVVLKTQYLVKYLGWYSSVSELYLVKDLSISENK